MMKRRQRASESPGMEHRRRQQLRRKEEKLLDENSAVGALLGLIDSGELREFPVWQPVRISALQAIFEDLEDQYLKKGAVRRVLEKARVFADANSRVSVRHVLEADKRLESVGVQVREELQKVRRELGER